MNLHCKCFVLTAAIMASAPVFAQTASVTLDRIWPNTYCRDKEMRVVRPFVVPTPQLSAREDIVNGILQASVNNRDCYLFVEEVGLDPPGACTTAAVKAPGSEAGTRKC